jgi:hypothetical protein
LVVDDPLPAAGLGGDAVTAIAILRKNEMVVVVITLGDGLHCKGPLIICMQHATVCHDPNAMSTTSNTLQSECSVIIVGLVPRGYEFIAPIISMQLQTVRLY